MNWDKEEKPTNQHLHRTISFRTYDKKHYMSNKVARKVYARFSSRFPAHSRTPPLLLSNKNEDPSGAVNLSGLQRVIMGLTSIRTQSSFIPGHRADSWKRKKKFTMGKTPVHSTSALLLLGGGDGQSYDSLLLASKVTENRSKRSRRTYCLPTAQSYPVHLR